MSLFILLPGNYTSTCTEYRANENPKADTCSQESNSGPFKRLRGHSLEITGTKRL